MAKFGLDTFDQTILAELDINARNPFSKIGKKIRKSKQFVEYRVKKLEEKGIIRGYKAIVDMSKFGFSTYRFYFKLQQLTTELEHEFVNFLKQDKNVWEVVRIHGKWDFAVFAGVKSINELHETWSNINRKFKSSIIDYNTVIYAPVYFLNRRFFLEGSARIEEKIYGNSEETDFDAKDFEIIKVFAGDVKQSLAAIGKKCNISADTVLKRIKKMEQKKIIAGYKLDLDVEALGHIGYRVDLYLASTEELDKLMGYCRNHKNIYLIIRSIGGADLELSIVVKNLYELLEIMDQMQKEFKESIKNYDYFNFSTYYALNYIPD